MIFFICPFFLSLSLNFRQLLFPITEFRDGSGPQGRQQHDLSAGEGLRRRGARSAVPGSAPRPLHNGRDSRIVGNGAQHEKPSRHHHIRPRTADVDAENIAMRGGRCETGLGPAGSGLQ